MSEHKLPKEVRAVTTPTTLAQWRAYLAESLAPLVTIGISKEQRWFAEYETGGRILEMCEHLEEADWQALLTERGINQGMKRSYIARFLAEVRAYVTKQAERGKQP